MEQKQNILTDTFGRHHNYLRISLTERCNLRCTYCMPAEGIQLSPKSHIMTYDEVYTIAKKFVDHGVTKIRLTGGEPLIRKDVDVILEKLASLPVELAITTNAITVDRFVETFKRLNIKNINVSLDSLDREKFRDITRRDYFDRVYNNIKLLAEEGFYLKLNCVLIKNFNENEIVSFIRLTEKLPLHVRFIEFMPFDGNKWQLDKMVSYEEIMNTVKEAYDPSEIERIEDRPNDTSRNYQIKNYQGTFAVISSVTNPFCDSCNRIRLTANGQLKNCLFSSSESDLLTPLRNGEPIEPIIEKLVRAKFKVRSGMDTLDKFNRDDLHSGNRSMITIGG
ncbi:GTP 3',8-cyclase MoaA [Leptobacterium flavescens]|uniref:GTP 3',8-cyclase n=1 Tax=Leptobacterium flavescens TaxID=472055 RepID=A0A6P0UF44_9FLAO|nr:GTP 3',8-cyclase MoaA [Leptobacterium flavescens]NER11865.1 GTP 3',8-cyclase MoaA [Leptobacterium flavescens]